MVKTIILPALLGASIAQVLLLPWGVSMGVHVFSFVCGVVGGVAFGTVYGVWLRHRRAG